MKYIKRCWCCNRYCAIENGDVFCGRNCARVYWIINTPRPFTKVILRRPT